MKRLLFIFCVLIVTMSLPVLSNAQTVQFGLNYGTSVLNWFNYESVYVGYNSISYGEAYNPKIISTSVGFRLPGGIVLRAAFGYGRTSQDGEVDIPHKEFTADGMQIEIRKYNEIVKTRVSGVSIETAVLYPIAIDKAQKFLVYPGIGFGYYYYSYSGDWEFTEEHSMYTTKGSGKFEESTLSGIGQTFILGIEVKAAKWLSFFLEFSKLGFSGITDKSDIDFVYYKETDNVYSESMRENTGTVEEDYISNGGLIDVAVTFGIKIGI